MIAERLAPHRDSILDAWRSHILKCYPEEGRVHLRKGGDPFGNPIGAAILEATGPLYDQLVSGVDCEDRRLLLDRLIRPRAIQEFKPSQAVGFVQRLRNIVRDVLAGEGGSEADVEFREFSDRMDRLTLEAFDVYTQCREDVFSIRLKEVRNRSLKAFERLNEWQVRKYGGAESPES